MIVHEGENEELIYDTFIILKCFQKIQKDLIK